MIRQDVWFWQRIMSPHMTELASAMAAKGWQVTYVAERSMSEDRARLGWSALEMPGVRVLLADSTGAVSDLVDGASAESVHICQGIRANGRVGDAQKALARRGLRHWVVMETVDDHGWRGVFKRWEYARLFRKWRACLNGVLAIGYRTADWVAACGVSADKVFPFAYFVPQPVRADVDVSSGRDVFRFIFVGQLIQRKRVRLLLDAMSGLTGLAFEMIVIGSGPLEPELRAWEQRLPTLKGRVRWLGSREIGQVAEEVARADCLVLPSKHDGWGVVVSEALLVGTPVVCSDACGSAGVVRASKAGGVFKSGSRSDLRRLLRDAVAAGRVTPPVRHRIATWASILSAEAGADYLCRIILRGPGLAPMPAPPWSTMSDEGKTE